MMQIIIKKTVIPITDDLLDTVEGEYHEARVKAAIARGQEPPPFEPPDAHKSMALCSIYYGKCVLCGWGPAQRLRTKERDLEIAAHVEKCFDEPQV